MQPCGTRFTRIRTSGSHRELCPFAVGNVLTRTRFRCGVGPVAIVNLDFPLLSEEWDNLIDDRSEDEIHHLAKVRVAGSNPVFLTFAAGMPVLSGPGW